MIVYLFEADFPHELIGPYRCPASPEEPGKFLKPVNCLEVEPMPAEVGKARVAVDGAWQKIDDVRGAWYKPNGDVVILKFLTDTPENNWTREAPAPVIPPKTQFTSLEFLDRFTESEQLAVVQATMLSAAVKLWYDRLLAASFVDIADPRTEAGIDALIAAELLEAGRKAALLAPEVV